MANRFIAFVPVGDRGQVLATEAPTHGIASPGVSSGELWIRDLLFLATFLLTWFTVAPFPDLGNPELLQPQTTGDLLGQVSTVLLTGSLAAFVVAKRSALIPRVVTLPLVLTLAAFAISAVLSSYHDIALRRLLLAMFTIFQASAFLLLPRGREHFARLLATGAIIVLIACYAGVALIPQYAIHQPSDIAEPGLAGDWRGFFTHKNGAGAAMVMLIFIGVFVCRSWSRVAGILIIALAAVFLEFTHSKSPRNLLPLILLLSYFLPRLRSSFLALVMVVGVTLGLNLLTVGSVMFAPVQNLVGATLSDPTFTGRDVIWSFALDHVAQRPLFGFGFEAFWGMPDLVADWNYMESWGYRASDAHNSYLNLAVTTGLIGLALALCWIVFQPFADQRRANAWQADQALTTLFTQIWLFDLCLGSFESVFFSGGSCLWFMTVVAIIGLRFQSLARNAA
jgi:O-antigen ligase